MPRPHFAESHFPVQADFCYAPCAVRPATVTITAFEVAFGFDSRTDLTAKEVVCVRCSKILRVNIHTTYAPILRHFRRPRMRRFAEYFQLTGQTKVLDIGGYPGTWDLLEVRPRLTILNLAFSATDYASGIECVVGDGCRTSFPDKSFDVVFSNSVIEHVGTLEDQKQFARECQRCGTGYFVQTPNKWFPVDPHTLMPLAHWFPTPVFTTLMKLSPRFLISPPSPQELEDFYKMRLLGRRDLEELFPGAEILEEKIFGLTKSLIAAFKQES
jgi:SAM-dependent methyltransferase